MSNEMNNQSSGESDNEPVRSTRRNADQIMAESCPNQNSIGRTRSGRRYSAPDRSIERQRETPALRPLRTVQFNVDVELGDSTEPLEVPGTNPRSHQTQLEPRDMTLTMVGDQGEPPQPVRTSTPDESVNLETIHQDVCSVLRSLQTLEDDMENGRFAARQDVLAELRRPPTPDEEMENKAVSDQVELKSRPHTPQNVQVNPSGLSTPVDFDPIEGTKNESSASNQGGTDTQESMTWDDHMGVNPTVSSAKPHEISENDDSTIAVQT